VVGPADPRIRRSQMGGRLARPARREHRAEPADAHVTGRPGGGRLDLEERAHGSAEADSRLHLDRPTASRRRPLAAAPARPALGPRDGPRARRTCTGLPAPTPSIVASLGSALVSVVLGGLGVMFTQSFVGGLGVIIGGSIGVRIWCELLMVLFKIHSNLKVLADKP